MLQNGDIGASGGNSSDFSNFFAIARLLRSKRDVRIPIYGYTELESNGQEYPITDSVELPFYFVNIYSDGRDPFLWLSVSDYFINSTNTEYIKLTLLDWQGNPICEVYNDPDPVFTCIYVDQYGTLSSYTYKFLLQDTNPQILNFNNVCAVNVEIKAATLR